MHVIILNRFFPYYYCVYALNQYFKRLLIEYTNLLYNK